MRLPRGQGLVSPLSRAAAVPLRHRTGQRTASWPQQAGRRLLVAAAAEEPGGDDFEVAVFRFTLGIPGFDDAQIPRAVGGLGAALLLLNRTLDASAPSEAQTWAEGLALLLVSVCLATPSLEQRLRQSLPGQAGRAVSRPSAVASTPGSRDLFLLTPGLSEAAKTELAWASFALLRNTICSTVLVVGAGGKVLLARGTWQLPAGGASQEALGALSQASQSLLQGLASAATGTGVHGQDAQVSAYWPTAGSRAACCGDLSGLLPAGSEAVLVQGVLGRDGQARACVLLASSQPRAFQRRERLWADNLTAKLLPVLLS